MDSICTNIFRTVNRIRYDDESDRIVYYPPSSITPVNEDTSSTASSSQPSNTAVIQPRRELVWLPEADSDTDLRKISQQYGSFVCRNRSLRRRVRRFYVIDSYNQAQHRQSNEYPWQLEELTLTPAILNNSVIVHPTPRPCEVCCPCRRKEMKEISSWTTSSMMESPCLLPRLPCTG